MFGIQHHGLLWGCTPIWDTSRDKWKGSARCNLTGATVAAQADTIEELKNNLTLRIEEFEGLQGRN